MTAELTAAGERFTEGDVVVKLQRGGMLTGEQAEQVMKRILDRAPALPLVKVLRHVVLIPAANVVRRAEFEPQSMWVLVHQPGRRVYVSADEVRVIGRDEHAALCTARWPAEWLAGQEE